jgi:hypothetical protein
MHKTATKCNKIQSKWCINKNGASKIIDTFETHLISDKTTTCELENDFLEKSWANYDAALVQIFSTSS